MSFESTREERLAQARMKNLCEAAGYSFDEARRMAGFPDGGQDVIEPATAVIPRQRTSDELGQPQTEEGVGYIGGVPPYVGGMSKLSDAEVKRLRRGVALCRQSLRQPPLLSDGETSPHEWISSAQVATNAMGAERCREELRSRGIIK